MSEASRERLWNILYPNKPYKPKGSPVYDPNSNDSITRDELKRALKNRTAMLRNSTYFYGYLSTDALADELVNSVTYPGKDEPVPGKDEPVTFTELSDALRRLAYADSFAHKIYNDIKEHREPEWKAGDIVKSKSNTIYTRLATGSYWMDESTGAAVNDTYPQRPLTLIGRMV